MSINFPTSPTNNQIFIDTTTGNRYVYNDFKGQWRYQANSLLQSVAIGQVLYNNNGDIAGSAGLVFSNVSNTLYVNTLSVSGATTVSGDLSIAGNLYITGNTTALRANNLFINDPLIFLAANNYAADIIDIGFVGAYNNGSANLHTGLYRDHLSKQYYLFSGYDEINLSAATDIVPYSNNMVNAVLNADLITSNLSLGGANAINRISSAFDKANSAYANANSVAVSANTWANTVGAAGNNYTNAVGLAGNNYASILVANNAVGANGWANTVGTAGNNYTSILAANNAIGANAYANLVGFSVNTYASILASNNAIGANAWANTISTSGNAYINNVGLSVNTYTSILAANNAVGSNNWANTVGVAGNNYTNFVGLSVNTYASILAANNAVAANAWANTVGTSGNNYINAVGVAGNAYASILSANNAAGSNAWANTVATAANNYMLTTTASDRDYTNTSITAANNYINTVGASGNSYALTTATDIGTAGNNYTNAVGTAGNNYTNILATAGNNYTSSVGIAGNNYTNSVGLASNNYTNSVGAAGNSYAQQVGSAANAYTSATYYAKSGGLISGDVGITGNLTISGTTTFANTQQLQVGDNIITLNADLPLSVTPIDDAGIEVNRGNKSSNASLIWIEGTGQWGFTGNNAQTLSTFIASNTLVEQYSSAGNSYTQQVGTAGNNYTNSVGTAGNNWATATFATLSNVAIVYNTSNVAFNTANAAFASANNVAPQVTPAYNTANSAYNTANASYASINSNWTVLNASYSVANNAYITANAAFAKANNALANTTGTLAGNLTVSGSTTSNNGFVSLYDYRGSLTDGIVVDYVNGIGRISVGANDALTFYNGGIGTIPILTLSQYGFVGIGNTNPTYPVTISANGATITTLAGAIFSAEGSENGPVQLNIRNARNGTSSSGDFIVTADDGNDSSNYIDLGINSSTYAQAGWTINGARDGYLYASNSNLAIGTANTTAFKSLSFFVGGTLAGNEVLRIQDSTNGSNVGIGRTDPKFKLDVVGTINASNILLNGAPITATGGASVNVGATTPSSPTAGNLWWDTDSGRLFIYYADGDSNQWVEASPMTGVVDTSVVVSYVTPAYNNSNLAFTRGNTAYTQSNLAYTQANAAYTAANNVNLAPPYNTANLAYIQANAAYTQANSALQNTNFTLSGNLTTTGIVSDYKGDVRSSPISAQTTSYILTSGDNGKTISTNTGVTVPNTVISTGQMFSVFNNSASSITITSAGSITMYLGGSSTTGNRTLATYGIATILCVAANTFVITGAGLT